MPFATNNQVSLKLNGWKQIQCLQGRPWLVLLRDSKCCVHSESPRECVQGLSAVVSTLFATQLIWSVFGSARESCNSPFPVSVLTEFSLDPVLAVCSCAERGQLAERC